jgi:membrane protein
LRRNDSKVLMASRTLNTNRVSLREIVRRTWGEIRSGDVLGRASQLAYCFFLALFPFLICVIATLSVFGNADRGRALLFGFLAQLLPGAAFQLITTTFSQILQASGPLKVSLGIIASIWSASLGMSAAMDTLNAAYHVKETRAFWKQYLISILLTIGMGLLVVASTLIVIIGDDIARALALPHAIRVVWQIAKWPLAAGMLLFGFAVTYYFAPDLKRRNWHWITPGSIAAVFLLMLISIGLRVYLHFAGTYTATYGALGGVIVLLLCFYLGGVAVLVGGVLNGVLEEAHKP